MVIGTGAITLAIAVAQWRSDDLTRFLVFLVFFALAATVKVRIPGLTGTYSPVFFFVLLASTMLSFAEVSIAAGLAGTLQCTIRPERRPTMVQVCFNTANLVLSTVAGFGIIAQLLPGLPGTPHLLCFFVGSAIFYLMNTGMVSMVLTLVEGGKLSQIWDHWCFGSLPFFVVGSITVAATIGASSACSFFGVILGAPLLLVAALYCFRWSQSRAKRD